MTRLVLLRHGRTAWNAEKRLQGRQDIPLSDAGRAILAGQRLPEYLMVARCHVSPLARAQQTARLLGVVDPHTEPRLVEMHFGAYEGHTLAALRERDPAMAANEALGLDFLPPGGESPRQVQARLRPWLEAIAAQGGQHVAITHKGVMRAVLALACDWDMTSTPPLRLNSHCMHLFTVDETGHPQIDRVNVSLEGE